MKSATYPYLHKTRRRMRFFVNLEILLLERRIRGMKRRATKRRRQIRASRARMMQPHMAYFGGSGDGVMMPGWNLPARPLKGFRRHPKREVR